MGQTERERPRELSHERSARAQRRRLSEAMANSRREGIYLAACVFHAAVLGDPMGRPALGLDEIGG